MADPASLPPTLSHRVPRLFPKQTPKNLLGETKFAWESQAKVSLGKGNALGEQPDPLQLRCARATTKIGRGIWAVTSLLCQLAEMAAAMQT